MESVRVLVRSSIGREEVKVNCKSVSIASFCLLAIRKILETTKSLNCIAKNCSETHFTLFKQAMLEHAGHVSKRLQDRVR